MSENSKYREMFVQEALEHVESLNTYLLKLEEEPDIRDHVDVLFRSAHTLKGMAATMDYTQIREMCKAIETIFDKFRQNEEKINKALASVIFEGIDLIKQMVEDETKKIDLEQYLSYLANPSEFKKTADENTPTAGISNAPTIRVKMEDLDSLVNLVGELMICKMRLEQTSQGMDSDATHDLLMNFGRLITDLQYQTMKLRLVRIDQIFSRFPRMIRDIATTLNKEINLEMDGINIELDRTVLDSITDPLLHILRNAADHGIESPSERENSGKPRYGTIILSAARMGDRVEIVVDDDGKGIDLEAIKAKAMEKKLISQAEAERMTDEEIISLIGTPGLSSAKTVTDLSGRGVGMDVVITQIEKVGGQVKIKTEKGKGTKMILRIPLSLAIIGGLLVNVANQKYILPLSSITTTVTVNNDEIKNVHGKEVITLRGHVVPLVRLTDVLGIKSELTNDIKVTVVIVDKGGKSYGLVVDSLDREQEVVIKRLDNIANSSSSFSDATILPDGRVALILEPSMVI